MSISIGDDLKKQATKCEKDCACLGENSSICPVAIKMDTGVLFVDYNKRRSCKYKMSYGYKDTICTCPVRKELYSRYKI
jgi:hypothetical protein